VPDAERLITEIERVLRPGGICFFSAGNRFSLIEPHYKLPLLSVVPKFVAHLYLRILGRGSRYHETHRSYWGLRRLVKKFELTDYTYRVVQNPEKYAADDMLTLGSIKHLFARVFVRVAYFLCPTYLWVLKKRC
jgi:SAM-dependent methyltransferase